MNHLKRNILLYFFLILILNARQNAFAGYDVVNATTVGEEVKLEIDRGDGTIQTMNDIDEHTYNEENNIGLKLEKKVKSFFDKKRKKNKKTEENEDIVEETNSETEISEVVSQEPDEEVKNKFQINADKITYNDDDGNVYATGHVEIMPKSKDVRLKADEAILDKATQTIKLHGDVKVVQGGAEMTGEYLLIDLNEQNILMDDPVLNAYQFNIKAQEGYLIANDIQMLNGSIKTTAQKDIVLASNKFKRLYNVAQIEDFGDDYENPRHDDNPLDIVTSQGSTQTKTYRIDAKEIVLTSYKEHNSVLMKRANIFYKNHKVIRNTDVEILSDKKNQVIEVGGPEAGNLRNFGTYMGYGFVSRLPHGHTLKLAPVLAYSESSIGAGLISRYRSPNHFVEGGWNTASENLVVRGSYRLSDSFTFGYGRNAYIPEGFLGATRSGYAAQLQYQKSYFIEDLKASYSHAITGGLFSDYQRHDQENAYATTRFRYMTQLTKKIAEYKNVEQDFAITLRAMAQAAGTVYGSGETFGIARIGPTLGIHLKNWESNLAYLTSGVHGKSPFLFDDYRYGKTTIMLGQKYNFNDKLALGFRVYVTPQKDNYKGDLLTESRFYVILGPQDFKFALSYDFVRDIAHMDFMFLLGSKNTIVNFDKLTTKNADGGDSKTDFYKNAKRVKIVRPNENI